MSLPQKTQPDNIFFLYINKILLCVMTIMLLMMMMMVSNVGGGLVKWTLVLETSMDTSFMKDNFFTNTYCL